ncbi:MAG: diaminopimelate epimerase [Pseudomonadota bacterium]
MTDFEFFKMSGHGNDFIFVDNWDGKIKVEDMPGLAKALCRRRISVGADGLVFLEEGPPEVDFSWRFFNSDGSEAEMCGNAARCAALFANLTGIAPAEMSFMTKAGVINAVVAQSSVKAQLTAPGLPEMDYSLEINGQAWTFSSLNTGVPHAVAWVDDIDAVAVVEVGRAVREHAKFKPAGANVDFVKVLGPDQVAVRTYERGVEGETLACGTGAAAAVLLSAKKGLVKSPAKVLTRGGEDLTIHFTLTADGFGDVFLEGPVRVVYTAKLGPDALK